jgi:hypothetical protein
MSKKSFLIILFFISFASSAQNQLSFSSVFMKETNFNFSSNQNLTVTDSITVPPGYTLKIEGSSVVYESAAQYRYLFGSFNMGGMVMIDKYMLINYLSISTQPSAGLNTLWLGEGTHNLKLYLYAGSSGGPYNGVLSINGLMFKIDP